VIDLGRDGVLAGALVKAALPDSGEIAGALSRLAEQQIGGLTWSVNDDSAKGNGHVAGTSA
jgi:hypothetical protein